MNAFGMPAVLPIAGRQSQFPQAMSLQQAFPLQHHQLPMAPICGQQSPMAMGAGQTSQVVAQQGPAMYSAYPQAPSASPQTSPASCDGSPVGEDLMATFMPEAFAMDRKQLAEHLRAATPCSYDD